MGKIKIIKEVVVNGFKINNRTKFEDVESEGNGLTVLEKAWMLRQDNAYPRYFKKQIKEYFGNQQIEITVSNHKKYKKEREENPEWFE